MQQDECIMYHYFAAFSINITSITYGALEALVFAEELVSYLKADFPLEWCFARDYVPWCLLLCPDSGVVIPDAWTTWFVGCLPPALLGMVITPILLFKLFPPEVSVPARVFPLQWSVMSNAADSSQYCKS